MGRKTTHTRTHQHIHTSTHPHTLADTQITQSHTHEWLAIVLMSVMLAASTSSQTFRK